MLKGWFDRVFVSGGIYTSRMRYDTGYFRQRKAMVSVTTGAPEESFGPGARGGDLETMLWPVHYSLHYLGFSVLPPFVSYGIQGHGYAYRDVDDLAAHLDRTISDWRSRLSRLTDLEAQSFPGWGDWEASGQATGRPESADALGQSGRIGQDAQT
jgi:NAD(P)H dehydrogenase (quinone)